MENKKHNLILIVVMCILIIIVVSLYSINYYKANMGNTSLLRVNKVIVGNLMITYEDTNSIELSSNILNNSDSLVFSVENLSSDTEYFKIDLSSINGELDGVVYSLDEIGNSSKKSVISNKVLNNSDISIGNCIPIKGGLIKKYELDIKNNKLSDINFKLDIKEDEKSLCE